MFWNKCQVVKSYTHTHVEKKLNLLPRSHNRFHPLNFRRSKREGRNNKKKERTRARPVYDSLETLRPCWQEFFVSVKLKRRTISSERRKKQKKVKMIYGRHVQMLFSLFTFHIFYFSCFFWYFFDLSPKVNTENSLFRRHDKLQLVVLLCFLCVWCNIFHGTLTSVNMFNDISINTLD